MPAVNASGEIFSLNGDARYEGIVNGRVGGGATLSVSLEAEACHGYSVEASAAALVDVNAALSLLFAVQGSAFATAAAGVNAKVQLKPDLFDRFGVIVDAAAYAEASAGFRLGVGLDPAVIVRWAREQVSGAALQIFLAFLQEIVVGVGVWGRASAAAMAQAHVDITLSLADSENAGFVIEAGAAAGLGAGTGWDFYGEASFTDVRRFYRTAVRIIAREAAGRARAQLPGELQYAGDIIELLLPIALNGAFELGQTAALQTLGPPEQTVQKLVGAAALSLRDFAFQRVLDLALAGIDEAIADCTRLVLAQGLGEEDQARFETALDNLIAYVREREDRDIALEDLPELSSRVIAVVEVVLPDELARHRQAIALLWTAVACAKALAEFVPLLSGSIGVIGVGGGSAASPVADLPTAPQTVVDAYSETLGRAMITIGYDDAIDFLLAVGIEPLADEHLPGAMALLRDLSDRLDVTAGDLIELALRFDLDADDAPLTLYGHLRGFIARWLDDTLRGTILPRLREVAGAEGRAFVTEVAQPSLAALSEFLLAKLDAVVLGVAADEESVFLDKLSAGCSTVVYRIFARNLVFFEHLLFEHLLDSFETAFQDVAAAVESDPAHVAVQSLATILPLRLRDLPVLAEAQIVAVQKLAGDLARIGIDAFGPGVWNAERRARYGRLKRDALLGYEGEQPFADENAAENFVRELILCEFVPNSDAIGELARFLGEQLIREAEIIVPRGVVALELFALRVTRAIVDEIDRRAREFLSNLAALVDAALRVLGDWMRAVADAIDAAEAMARDVETALDDVAAELGRGRRRQVKDALYAQGSRVAEQLVRDTYGDPNVVEFGEDEAVWLAVRAFHTAYFVAEPLIDLAIDAVSAVADGLSDVVGGAADAAEALELIVAAVVDAALDAVDDGLASLGIDLPDEMSAQDIADAIADALPTGVLLTLLDAFIAAQDAWIDALDAQHDAEAARDRAQADYDRRRARNDGARATAPVRIDIVSPLALPHRLRDMWRYGCEVPMIVRVAGVTPAFFERGRGRRVRVALNGKSLHYEPTDWRARDDGRYEWQAVLRRPRHALVTGVNVLEVTVTPGEAEMKRATVAFVVDLNGPPLSQELVVDGDASRFDTAGNDHRELLEEKVVLRSRAKAPLAMVGWRVLDGAARHTYRIAEFTLPPDAPVTLVTGGSADDDDDETLYWGRSAAVWNNTGDVVNVVDERGVLRSQFFFEP